MKHIILALIALVALSGLLPAIVAEPAAPVLKDKVKATPEPAENSVLTTASQAAFLNDSWAPSQFQAPLADQAMGGLNNLTRNNTTLNNSTFAILDFLDENYTPPAAVPPVYTATGAKKGGELAWTGEAIYDFLSDAWTPSSAVQSYEQSPFKMHQMN
ncbi:MAG: hypothetical protein LUQ10_01490 [Methanothrix sp.]|nr:hypothetical protein [Methanothrix sp.]